MKLTASDIVAYIDQLPKNRTYTYINPKTKGIIKIVEVRKPEGPILFKRYNPNKGETLFMAKEESISSEMVWRVANSFFPNQPINIDRILGGSYNTRSVLETLIAHTPQFYYCYPGRIESIRSKSIIKKGHKHLMWCPENPHASGQMYKTETDIVVSEVPNVDVFYDRVFLPEEVIDTELDINLQRRHSQIQVALIKIGQQLGFRTWIAQNDKGVIYNNKPVGEMDSVIRSLRDEQLISAFEEAYNAAKFIDCIWFKNGNLMPAVMEVEHSTGVRSGLTRMKDLQNAIPSFLTRYVIVAPDEDRNKVFKEANRSQFHSLDVRYFPYSAVEELYSLCQRRKIQGITEKFLDSFMEPTFGLIG
ncbi:MULTISPECIES: restriction endonuclease [Bacillus]|jgi:type II restriction enzyme|uniref:restriction endonuclease n=1 Tax=Bacillus TaxID=1386 RepID=UPI001BDBA07E|nr:MULTISPECIES: restriction endonuclease [Bacillus]MCM2583847.1 restriction endonuclease [Bacillus stercoris]MCY8797931.1 restriction endonuclease [Bacillus inaquosorum]MEC0769990.1 restriction endonuclease [Bacillus inaquosorum]MEC0796488.1 restriction endonuclease [Bacillus inaquosorum]WGE38429.1 restriction endonuclease [Bacillus stercoris]